MEFNEDILWEEDYKVSVRDRALTKAIIDTDEEEVIAILKYFPNEKRGIKNSLTSDTWDRLQFMINNVSFTKEETNNFLNSFKEKTLIYTKQIKDLDLLKKTDKTVL